MINLLKTCKLDPEPKQLTVEQRWGEALDLLKWGHFTVWEPGNLAAPIACFKKSRDAERFSLLDELEAAAFELMNGGLEVSPARLNVVLGKLKRLE